MNTKQNGTTEARIYSVLAHLYDTLMQDVDYEAWADFIDEILQTHHPRPKTILELAGGTGSMSIALAELGFYDVTGSDGSPEMVARARNKISESNIEIPYEVINLKNVKHEDRFDAVVSVFDSINYLHTAKDIKNFLSTSENVLNKDGLLIFDFSTPQNSLEAVDYLNDEEGEKSPYRYYRNSYYNPEEQFHYNKFEIDRLSEDGSEVLETFVELHKQRVYTLNEILSLIEETSYHLVAKYDGFDLIDADEYSTRVTMVLRCQKTQ